MHLLKYIIVGAVVGLGINYITQKGEDGRSILDDLTDKAPDFFDKAKKFAEDTIGNISHTVKENVSR
jgi:hypothetical protein